MTDRQIFEHLFEIAKASRDSEGVVAACLVKNGEILVASPSADNSIRHADDLVIEKASKENIVIEDNCILYTTLEPCSFRTKNDVEDCTTIIIRSGIKNLVYGANDPEYSKDTNKRFKKDGINYHQTHYTDLVKRSADLFNSTIVVPLKKMRLPRSKKI